MSVEPLSAICFLQVTNSHSGEDSVSRDLLSGKGMLGADHRGARGRKLEAYPTRVISFHKEDGSFVETPRCDVTPVSSA